MKMSDCFLQEIPDGKKSPERWSGKTRARGFNGIRPSETHMQCLNMNHALLYHNCRKDKIIYQSGKSYFSSIYIPVVCRYENNPCWI